MEFEYVDTSPEGFPYITFRVVGGIQTAIGAVCVLLGAIDLLITLLSPVSTGASPTASLILSQNELHETLPIFASPIWCGLWFILIGSLATAMSPKKLNNLKTMKTAYLVMSILTAVLFAPLCCALAGTTAFLRSDRSDQKYGWFVPMFAAFLALVELVLGIIAACICCCCSPLKIVRLALPIHREQQETNNVFVATRNVQTGSSVPGTNNNGPESRYVFDPAAMPGAVNQQ